jgi:hypothetical protein
MRLLKSQAILRLVNSYLVDSPQPANISYLWNFGSLLGVCLVMQILTGVFLAMHYTPHVDFAFNSVEHIMRDVNAGWALRYTHANVASFFFIFVYCHIARGLFYSSYKTPRILVWSIGVIILIVMMATAFLGLITGLKWLNMDLNFILIKSSLFISPKLKFWLEHYNIKPISVYEEIHTKDIKDKIILDTKKKAGIYSIFNLITGDFYIGSATTNRLYSRFYKHLIVGLGNKYICYSVKKYGLENFSFIILETEEITNKNNIDLMALETKWLKQYLPSYNILLEAGNSFGYKHSEETKQKMKENYSKERKDRVAFINKKKINLYQIQLKF